jgi:glycosyltransferase involved in cell wall biosynthesis
MTQVTVGVPVYNAEGLLDQCLENLRTQTHSDFKVVILDNASTDRTGAIAEAFTRKDGRFSYKRQPYNKGCRQNFADALSMANTPYFMWRAHDDRSSRNYIERLSQLLDSSPDAALAVGRVNISKRGRTRIKTFPRQSPLEPDSVFVARLLFLARASWIYGLYRTNDLRWSLRHVTEHYSHVHAFDPLTILPFLIQRRVVASDDTEFIQGFVDREGGTQEHGILDPSMMQSLRDDFRHYCSSALPHLVGDRARRGLVRPALWLYADKSYRLVKILEARARMMFGEKPHAATTKYD